MNTVSIIIPTVGRLTLEKVLKNLLICEGIEEIQPEIFVVFDRNKRNISIESELIQVLETKQKSYAAGARNLGLSKSTGDIIIFIGDDTYPEQDWLKKHMMFHQENPEIDKAYLGMIDWVPSLREDEFHKWLLDNGQFAFKKIKKKGANWQHFYTSNISLKRKRIGFSSFSGQFYGWGFEDIEFAYKISKKMTGLNIVFDPSCRVNHDHPQTFSYFLDHTMQAQKNAFVFETLHPEVRILPRGIKKIGLKIIVLILHVFPKELLKKSRKGQRLYWWREWKQIWSSIRKKESNQI